MKGILFARRHLTKKAFIASLSALVVSCTLSLGSGVSYAAPANSMYFQADSANTYKVGSNIKFTIRENSGAQFINAVEADFNYSVHDLKYERVDFSTSDFEVAAVSSASSGAVYIARGTTAKNISGDQIIGVIEFRVLATGPTKLIFKKSSGLASNGSPTNPTLETETFNLSAAQPTGPPPTAYTPVFEQNPAKHFIATPSPSHSSLQSVGWVRILPEGSNDGALVYDNQIVNISVPATITPSSERDSQIVAVKYYLNSKLARASKGKPYSYKLNTSNLKNGKYKLSIKTYFVSGKIALTNIFLKVSNSNTIKQIWLTYGRDILIVLGIMMILTVTIGRRRIINRLLPSNLAPEMLNGQVAPNQIDIQKLSTSDPSAEIIIHSDNENKIS